MKTVTIKPAKKYEILVDGESIGEFTKESLWNGMAQFKQDGASLILDMPSSFTTIIDRMMSDDEPEVQATVVKVSSSIAGKFIENDQGQARR